MPNEAAQIYRATSRLSAALNRFVVTSNDFESPFKTGETKHIPGPGQNGKFVSIWERLPEEGARVVVRCKTDTVYHAIYQGGFFESKTESKDGFIITRYKATEWAPMP